MKRILLLIVAVCFLAAACTKTVIKPGLFGRWELRSEVGGIAGIDSTYKAGNGTMFQFNTDSTYQHYIKGRLNDQGTFHVAGPNLPYANSVTLIYFNGSSTGEALSLSGTQLTIGTDYDDGITATYQKISD